MNSTTIAVVTVAFLVGLLGIGARRQVTSTPQKPSRDNPPPDAYFASLHGYRRARQSEVTPAMQSRAVEMLKEPLGSASFFGTPIAHAIAVESHFNDSKGWHKGATVFIRESKS